MQVIQRAIDGLGARTYLEIGVSDGTCFCTVSAPDKIGVDPIEESPKITLETKRAGARYFSQSSDAFFENTARGVLAGGVDVVFIDGLHTYAQAYRDCINSLVYLNPRGLILLHDCLPKSELEARVAENLDDAARLNSGSSWDGSWTGDVWKVIVRLRAQHTDLKTCVLNCDQGIGLVYRAQNDSPLPLTAEQIEAMSYTDLADDPKRLLDLRRPSELFTALKIIKSRSH